MVDAGRDMTIVAPSRLSNLVEGTRAAGEQTLSDSGSVDEEWGRSESLDPDNVGDIADEGAGHRG